MPLNTLTRVAALFTLFALTCGADCSGNGGTSPSTHKPTGSACTPTAASTAECEGAVCLSLNPNLQNRAGLCSQACTATECGAANICLDLGGGNGACFRVCASHADCLDGFVCFSLGDGTGRGACLVQVSGTAPGADGGFPIADGSVPAADGGAPVTVSDGDGNVYQSVLIGTQRWMTANLNTTKYRDGSPIPLVTDPDAWRTATADARCDYENVTSNSATYGRLYNWHAVNTGKLCPTGWHVPSDAEWTTLETFLGDPPTAGGKLKESGTAHWMGPNVAATNATGFTGLPGGSRSSTGGWFSITYDGYWWSTTTGSDPAYARYRRLDFNSGFIFPTESYKIEGLSVRCLKD